MLPPAFLEALAKAGIQFPEKLLSATIHLRPMEIVTIECEVMLGFAKNEVQKATKRYELHEVVIEGQCREVCDWEGIAQRIDRDADLYLQEIKAAADSAIRDVNDRLYEEWENSTFLLDLKDWIWQQHRNRRRESNVRT